MPVAVEDRKMRLVFASSAHVGHLNPMLPLARSLVDLGHEVNFRCMESVRHKIEATGAIFSNAVDTQPEFYQGRKLFGPLGALEDVMEEHSLDKSSFLSQLQILNIVLEQQLPGALRFLKELRPDAVVYDSILGCARDLMFAAKILRIPAVGVLSLAGPGAWSSHSATTMLPLTLGDADALVAGFQPHAAATARIEAAYGLSLCPGLPEPAGKMDAFDADVVLVTTSADLQDPLSAELAGAYAHDGTNFAFVGPLLVEDASLDTVGDEALSSVRAARAHGRPVVLVSMGTLLTSNHSLNGWEGCSGGSNLTGQELCHGAWAGAFEAFGSSDVQTGPLIVVSVGSQPGAMDGLIVPPNAICVTSVAQQAILREGVDVFLTHGGQNSFTEAMMYATPVVVCPGFGDQVVNSRKAETLGVGLKVDRPYGQPHGGEAASQYLLEVRRALLAVYANRESHKAMAAACEARLRNAGGLARAVELVISVATTCKPIQSADVKSVGGIHTPLATQDMAVSGGA